jgi:DNA-binding LytR/AlgR family response regulator
VHAVPQQTIMKVAKQASGKCHVVFVTAYDSYAVAAFDQGAVDYVMKPFSATRLATAVSRLRERVRGVPANLDGLLKALDEAATGRNRYLRWLTVSERDDLRLITVDEICYFRADNKYTVVVTPQQEALIRRSLKELIDELDPRIFLQIHRGTLVNANAIAGVTRDFGGRLWVKFKHRNEKLPVSEPYVHLFNRM